MENKNEKKSLKIALNEMNKLFDEWKKSLNFSYIEANEFPESYRERKFSIKIRRFKLENGEKVGIPEYVYNELLKCTCDLVRKMRSVDMRCRTFYSNKSFNKSFSDGSLDSMRSRREEIVEEMRSDLEGWYESIGHAIECIYGKVASEKVLETIRRYKVVDDRFRIMDLICPLEHGTHLECKRRYDKYVKRAKRYLNKNYTFSERYDLEKILRISKFNLSIPNYCVEKSKNDFGIWESLSKILSEYCSEEENKEYKDRFGKAIYELYRKCQKKFIVDMEKFNLLVISEIKSSYIDRVRLFLDECDDGDGESCLRNKFDYFIFELNLSCKPSLGKVDIEELVKESNKLFDNYVRGIWV
mgnify:FL=1|jgi:hypothetical protein|nr:MAG TPA: hypothetical protein [Bacteriophage sp.]